MTTRPTNKKQDSESTEQDTGGTEHDLTKVVKREGQSIQPGKLADESQIGGLSSLFTPQKSQTQTEVANVFNGANERDGNGGPPKPPKKRYTELPHPVVQKREIKADLFGEKKTESNNNNQQSSVGLIKPGDLLSKLLSSSKQQ